MSGNTYYEEKLYRPKNEDGKPNKEISPLTLDVTVSDYFGNSHQIYLRTTDSKGKQTILHLTKEQANSLAEALTNAAFSIGYNNE